MADAAHPAFEDPDQSQESVRSSGLMEGQYSNMIFWVKYLEQTLRYSHHEIYLQSPKSLCF